MTCTDGSIQMIAVSILDTAAALALTLTFTRDRCTAMCRTRQHQAINICVTFLALVGISLCATELYAIPWILGVVTTWHYFAVPSAPQPRHVHRS